MDRGVVDIEKVTDTTSVSKITKARKEAIEKRTWSRDLRAED